MDLPFSFSSTPLGRCNLLLLLFLLLLPAFLGFSSLLFYLRSPSRIYLIRLHPSTPLQRRRSLSLSFSSPASSDASFSKHSYRISQLSFSKSLKRSLLNSYYSQSFTASTPAVHPHSHAVTLAILTRFTRSLQFDSPMQRLTAP